jgi:hypothetical protein
VRLHYTCFTPMCSSSPPGESASTRIMRPSSIVNFSLLTCCLQDTVHHITTQHSAAQHIMAHHSTSKCMGSVKRQPYFGCKAAHAQVTASATQKTPHSLKLQVKSMGSEPGERHRQLKPTRCPAHSAGRAHTPPPLYRSTGCSCLPRAGWTETQQTWT